MGAPIGNQNNAKGKPLTDGLRRALARAGDGDMSVGINKVATRVVDAALTGEQWAIKEIADRLDGKPHQTSDVNVTASIAEVLGSLPVIDDAPGTDSTVA